jgi:hypothetical protein
MSAERDAAKATLENIKREHAEADFIGQLARLSAERDAANTSLDNIKREHAEADFIGQLARMRVERDRASNALENVVQSNSWKLMRPFRELRKRLGWAKS